MTETENQFEAIAKAFSIIAEALAPMIERFGKIMREMFPVVSQVQRAEVKRVRTAYRKKKGKKW